MLRSLWNLYSTSLDTNPILARIIVTLPIITGADTLAQKAEGHTWDKRRTFWIGVYGAVWCAPVSYNWFRFLSWLIPMNPPVLPKLATMISMDQLISSPIFVMAYITTRELIDGRSTRQIVSRLKRDTFPIWSVGFLFWVPVSFVNFYAVPLRHRVTFVNVASFLWNAYLATTVKSPESPPSSPDASRNL